MKAKKVAVLMALASMHLYASAEESSNSINKTPAADSLPEVSVNAFKVKGDYNPSVATVGGKVPTAIRDIPQTVTVINRAVMDAQGAASLTDALRNVPGITIGGAEGGQIGTNINLRGFSARTDIYLDGMRDRGQYYRDTFYLNAIEVLKGPSSMLFGRGSTGGVINQVRKLPTLGDHNEITATVGTDDYYRTTVDINKQLSDTSAMRIAVMGQNVGTTRDVMENEDYGIAPSLRFGIGTPTEVTLSALIEHNNDMPDYGIPTVNGKPAKVSYDNYYGLTGDRTKQDATILNASIKHVFNDSLTIRNQTQYGHYITDARETAFGRLGTLVGNTFTSLPQAVRNNGNRTSVSGNNLSALLISHDRKIDDTSLDNQTDIIAKFDTGSLKHTVIAGLEIGHDEYSNQSYSRKNPALVVVANGGNAVTNGVAAVSLNDPAYLSTPSGTIRTAGNHADSTADTLAGYVNDTLEFSKEWKAIVGARWDRYEADIKNTVSAPLKGERTDIFTSVRTGLIWQPTDVQSYYVSYGTSFNPSLEALTLTSGQQNVGPEESHAYEVGGKWDLFNGDLALTSSVFRIEKDNARTQTSTGVYNIDGKVRVNGFEAGLTGHLTPKWQLFAGYTYLDSEIVKASVLDGTQGKELANTPKNTAILWTSYNLTPEWEIGGGATAVSSVYAANANLSEAQGYTRYDATVAYHQPKYDLRLNVLNLTDKGYIASAQQSDGGRYVPGVGRTALATATYRF
jgi:catecholate siderophore receptor